MPGNIHRKIRVAASSFFLLLMIMLQAGKLLHACYHKAHERSAAKPSAVEKYHGAHFTQSLCSACEFEYCREALPENAISFENIANHATTRMIERVSSVIAPLYTPTDLRGPPSC